MRFAEGARAITLLVLAGSTSLPAQALSFVHQQRYCMGTMFDVAAYHPSRAEAERAIEMAMDEIARLDRVMSHFKNDSELSRLNRDARSGFVTVGPDLYDVIQTSLAVSRGSAGTFDVTIAPLVRMWKEAQADGRSPLQTEIAGAHRCVGYERIELQAPDRIRFGSDCLEIELGGIGKGYAVERAIAVLKSAGIRHAIVNAGTSSIASIGSAPGGHGWPVHLGPAGSGTELMLRDGSLSTSEQNGEIIDPRSAAPAASTATITVLAPSATIADALSTALLMMSRDEGAKLVERFPGASVVYQSDAR